jgi:predicted phage-related endonuclease
MFASIDRLINIKGGVNLITGEPITTEAILEIKNMSFWVSKVFEDGIPVQYLAQIHQYMIIMETDYAELCMLVDGNRLVVEKIQRDEELVKRILSITRSWWYDRVVPARDALKIRDEADANGKVNEAEQAEAVIQRLEPDPDHSEAYKDFMSDSFVKERDIVDGTMDLFDKAKAYEVLKGIKKEVDKAQNLLKNTFIKFMKDHGADSISFDNLGSVNWGERRGSASRTFGCKIKDKPKPDVIKDEFDKLNINCY